VIFAIILFHGTIGGAISPFIAGRVFDTLGTYQPVFICLSIIAVLGLALVQLLRSDTLSKIRT